MPDNQSATPNDLTRKLETISKALEGVGEDKTVWLIYDGMWLAGASRHKTLDGWPVYQGMADNLEQAVNMLAEEVKTMLQLRVEFSGATNDAQS